MRFVVDETSWRFDGVAPHACLEAFELMLDQLDTAEQEEHTVYYSEELFNSPVLGAQTFYELYAAESELPIPREIQERVAAIFGRLGRWEGSGSNPTDYDVQVAGGNAEFAPSVAWAHARTKACRADAVACVVFPLGRPDGCFDVAVNGCKVELWFIGSEARYREFFRWLIEATTASPDGMEKFSRSAFPELAFVEGVFSGIKKMSKGYGELAKPIVHHLSALSDNGRRIFLGPWKNAPREFGALGVVISPENGKTKSNSTAKAERTINVEGEDFIFWWHTKLEPDRDRIHIYPDRVAQNGKILVGIFCRHLTT